VCSGERVLGIDLIWNPSHLPGARSRPRAAARRGGRRLRGDGRAARDQGAPDDL